MDLVEALQSINMDEILDRMNAYASSRLQLVGIKSFNGKEPCDFVGEILLKVFEGNRVWNNAKCTFKEFLFGCLRSEIDNFLKSKKIIHVAEVSDITAVEVTESFELKKEKLAKLVEQCGADSEELIVFECWMDGLLKPGEIAIELGIDVKLVYNIERRLERSLQKVKKQAIDII
jgi:DNA-directed RNA polymerase specialized sigma24 family protein